MQNIHMFSVIILLVIHFKINYIHGVFLNDADLNYIGNQLQRSIRQTNLQECVPPIIPNGKTTILRSKFTEIRNFLSINITCDDNYILQPPNDFLMSCFNGFWDLEEIPQCKKCIKLSESTDNTESQLICPESLNEYSYFKDCGQRIDRRHKPFVVNGTLSKFAEFPWHVAIYKKDQIDTHPKYHCGGSIINEKSILTVAHCFSDAYGKSISSREYSAAAGKYHSNYNSDSETTQIRKVVRTDLHPRYKGELTNYAWDIAVITVDEPFVISTLVHPVCIDWRTHFENEHLSPDKYGEVAGWGKTEINLNAASSELRVLKVPFINVNQCINRVPNTFIRYITPDKFCAGYTNGSSVCDGDSGGGLVFERQEKGKTKYYIRGLVSVGLQNQGRCDEYNYSTYTKVSEYIPFIRECIQNKNKTTSLLSVSPTTAEQSVSRESLTEANVSCKTPNNEEAKCTSIYDCKIFVNALKKSPTPEVINYMKESVCGKANEKKVCCGSTINFLSVIHSNPVTAKPIEHSKLNLLPPTGVCGRRTRVRQGRIYGETATEILDYPWMAMLEFGTSNNSGGFLCSGSLINERYVLTAAHCAVKTRYVDSGQVFRVRLGEYDLDSKLDCVNLTRGTGLVPNGRNCADPPLNVDVEEVIIHPSYDSRKKINDIALLRLSKNISYTDFIKPICLPLHGEKSLPGKQMIISKWGKIDLDSPSIVKLKYFISAVSDEECNKQYTSLSHGRLKPDNTHVCAGYEVQKDECRGDSGGPLMTTLANSTDIYAEGVVSYSAGPCGHYPIISTKVAAFMDWILDVINP